MRSPRMDAFESLSRHFTSAGTDSVLGQMHEWDGRSLRPDDMTIATTSPIGATAPTGAARWGKFAVVFEIVAMLIAANFALWWIDAAFPSVALGAGRAAWP